MAAQTDYSKQMEGILREIGGAGEKPTLLLHACCAPCSSAVLEQLMPHFRLVLYYYNPNITDAEEFVTRERELRRLAEEMPSDGELAVVTGRYEPDRFLDAVRGTEDEPEGGARCRICFSLRLREAAKKAREIGADWFTTTLTISPRKDADLLNEIGAEAGREYGVPFLPSDFKKRDGAKRSIELSKQYDLYRQNYCGCEYSRRE